MLTKNKDSMFMGSIGPNDRRNSDQLVCEIVENIYVLPVVENIWIVCMCPEDKPWEDKKIYLET